MAAPRFKGAAEEFQPPEKEREWRRPANKEDKGRRVHCGERTGVPPPLESFARPIAHHRGMWGMIYGTDARDLHDRVPLTIPCPPFARCTTTPAFWQTLIKASGRDCNDAGEYAEHLLLQVEDFGSESQILCPMPKSRRSWSPPFWQSCPVQAKGPTEDCKEILCSEDSIQMDAPSFST